MSEIVKNLFSPKHSKFIIWLNDYIGWLGLKVVRGNAPNILNHLKEQYLGNGILMVTGEISPFTD